MTGRFRRDGPLADWAPHGPEGDPADGEPRGSDVVFWPRGMAVRRPVPFNAPTTAPSVGAHGDLAGDGTTPGVHDSSPVGGPDTVGDGPVVWRPAMMTPREETTVEAPGFTRPDLMFDPADTNPVPGHAATPAERAEVKAPASVGGRTRAIAIGLLVGCAVGLLIDAALSGWLHAL